MPGYKPSDTYKKLFDNIIGRFLSQILKEHKNYCLRSREVPYEIGKEYDAYKAQTNTHMSNPKLDRHKLASCICGAIIKARPISLSTGQIPIRVNEILALYTSLAVLKDYMMYDKIADINDFGAQSELTNYLKDNFHIILPSLEENICDTQEYQENLFNALYWSHHHCEEIDFECYHYDIWAYAKIFYHVERYNMPRLQETHEQYMNSRLNG